MTHPNTLESKSGKAQYSGAYQWQLLQNPSE